MSTSTAIKTLDDRIEEAEHASITVHEQLAMSRSEVAELRAALEAAEQKLAQPTPDLRLSIMRDSLLSAYEAFGKMLEHIDTGTPRRICTRQMQDINADLAKIALAAQPDRGRDAARLDLLEQMGNEPEGLLLHDGGDFTGRRGLGLRRIGRTLRQAVDGITEAQQDEKGGAS